MNFSVLSRFFLASIMLIAASTASAESLGTIKKRMLERLPTLTEYWQNGYIGEANTGYVAVPPSASNVPAQVNTVVAAENKDRALVYSAIAQQAGSSAEVVGQQRAVQIANRAAKGLLLQDSKGRWYQK